MNKGVGRGYVNFKVDIASPDTYLERRLGVPASSAEIIPVEPDLVWTSEGKSMSIFFGFPEFRLDCIVPNFRTEIQVWDLIGPLDFIVFFFILALTIYAVFVGHRRRRQKLDTDDFLDMLLMGRQLSFPMFVATLVATWYGGIFGVTQISFEKGVYNFLTQGVFWYVTYIVFAVFLAARVHAFKALTLPDLVGQMFGEKSRYVAGVFNFFNVVPIAYAISLGLFLQIIFGGSLQWNIFLGVGLVCLYSSVGGFRSVVFSDLIQFGVMCLSVLLVAVISIYSFGGVGFLQEHLPATHLSPLGGESWTTTLVWGLIALSTLVDPNFYQRCFAARNSQVAKYGILFSTLIWFVFDICTTLGGLYARSVIPEADSGLAYLTFSLQLLPEGLRGFFLAGILATILSTMDSYIFIAGTSLSYDLVPKKWRGSVWLTRAGIFTAGGLAILLSGHFEGDIRLVWKTLGSYSAACLLLPVLAGYIWPQRIRDFEFVLVCVLSAIAVSLWRWSDRSHFWAEIDEIYIGVVVSAIGLSFFALRRYLAGAWRR